MKSDMYFRHDLYALESEEIMELVLEHHACGYGVWWSIIERLTIAPSHRISAEQLSKQVAMKLCEKTSKVLSIIDFCVNVGLLNSENGEVWNDRVIRQCDKVEAKSLKNRENVMKRWNKPVEVKVESEVAPELIKGNECLDLINEYHSSCPSLPKVLKLTDARKKRIKTFVSEFEHEQILQGFRMAEESEFLRSGSGSWNGASFDWLINKANFVKVIEGNYKDRKNERSNVCNDAERMETNMQGGFDL